MVNGTLKTRLQRLLHYPFVTILLNIPRFLGLNMIEPPKPLADSGLAVFLLSVSNKTAPKAMKNAPILGRGGQNKFTNNISFPNDSTKVGIFLETTKNRHDHR